ncbi:hypothetical protein J122_2670 [Marinobacter excellens LAMA 842]|uniref:Uncharacterized protein n=1 Tax=Marinobacter excellens LAMA 842 TaxID=1306954 RepID=A0A137S809_9GAMM|nr:hypothetical protein J122_2670 [Marinobacter excellens LAMA 842]
MFPQKCHDGSGVLGAGCVLVRCCHIAIRRGSELVGLRRCSVVIVVRLQCSSAEPCYALRFWSKRVSGLFFMVARHGGRVLTFVNPETDSS